MTPSKYRYVVYALLAVGMVIGLYFSHRYAYHSGERMAGRPVVTTFIQEDEDADGLHLYYSVLALRVYARYPDTGSVSERINAFSLAKMQADMVEQRVIPRLRREGRANEADKLAGRVRETRTLIAAVGKKRQAK